MNLLNIKSPFSMTFDDKKFYSRFITCNYVEGYERQNSVLWIWRIQSWPKIHIAPLFPLTDDTTGNGFTKPHYHLALLVVVLLLQRISHCWKKKKSVIGVCWQHDRSLTLTHAPLQSDTLLCRCTNTFIEIYPKLLNGIWFICGIIESQCVLYCSLIASIANWS